MVKTFTTEVTQLIIKLLQIPPMLSVSVTMKPINRISIYSVHKLQKKINFALIERMIGVNRDTVCHDILKLAEVRLWY